MSTPKCTMDGLHIISPEETNTMLDLMSNPAAVRNIALVGNLHHGKTSFMDMLISDTHHAPLLNKRYLDVRMDEQEKKTSIKAAPISLVFDGSYRQRFLLNIMDTPGHTDFTDEATAALRLADGVVLMVDAVEGVSVNTRRAIRHAVEDRLPIVVVVNKIDKLITELNLHPENAYNKLHYTIRTINSHIESASSKAEDIQVMDPTIGNVCFASGSSGWSFTLQSFAKLHVKRNNIPTDAKEFADNLWGDVYYDPLTRRFNKKQPGGRYPTGTKAFVHFILNPLYKLYSRDEVQEKCIKATLSDLRVTLPSGYWHLRSVGFLLRVACGSVFGSMSGFAEMVFQFIPSPRDSAPQKVRNFYMGPTDSTIFRAMEECDVSGPTMVHITKLYPKSDWSGFDAFGRVYSGEIRTDQKLYVLGEGYKEDMIQKVVTKLWIYQTRYRIPVTKAPAGSWVLIEGLDPCILKTATLCSLKPQDICTFIPLQFTHPPLVKTLIEPLKPRVITGLKMMSKSYPSAIVNVENSGRCTVYGSGEFYLDCIVKDLMELYNHDELKVGAYSVQLCETIGLSSTFEVCGTGASPNQKNAIAMSVRKHKTGNSERIGNEITWSWVEDTQMEIKDYVVKGFQLAAKEGPLRGLPLIGMEVVVRNVSIAHEESDHTPLEIITAARHAAHEALGSLHSIVVEPIYSVEIQTPVSYVDEINEILTQRRGKMTMHEFGRSLNDEKVLFKYQAVLPVMESFGFEKDIGSCTQEQAVSNMIFDKWEKLPDHLLDALDEE